MCCLDPSALSPDPASLKAGTVPATASPASAVRQAGPEGHQDTVPDGMVTALECHLAAAAVPF